MLRKSQAIMLARPKSNAIIAFWTCNCHIKIHPTPKGNSTLRRWLIDGYIKYVIWMTDWNCCVLRATAGADFPSLGACRNVTAQICAAYLSWH